MKKTISIILSVLILLNIFGGLTVNATQIIENNFIFDTDTGTIKGYIGYSSELIIPDTIGGVPVTSIGDAAFHSHNELFRVTLGNNITTIGDNAFNNCSSLNSVENLTNVTSIGNQAFISCSELSNVVLGDNLTSIGDYAFQNCKMTNISIPDSVTSIGIGAFVYCYSLNSVTIGSGITSILDETFKYCTSLTSIVISQNVTSIGASAFQNCEMLSSITIPEGITVIRDRTFEGCESLTSVTLPDSVTSIETQAFAECQNLSSINFTGNLTSIGEAAFVFCAFTSIYIPATVTSLELAAFAACQSLTDINVDNENPNYSSENGLLLNKDKTHLITYPSGKTEIVEIPNSVTSVGTFGFVFNMNVTTLTLSTNIQRIDDKAIAFLPSLTRLNILNNAISIDENAISECSQLTIYGYDPSNAKAYAEASSIPFSLYAPNDNRQSILIYEVEASYTVIIPETVSISEGGGTIDIKGYNINTLPNEKVYVNISNGIDTNGNIMLTNQNDNSQTISSNITNSNGQVDSNTVLASFEGFMLEESIGGSINLSKPIDTFNKKAGVYTGTLTFNVSMR